MKIIKILDEKIEEVFLVGIISISVILLFIQVVLRYVFKNSIMWSEELARYLFLWMIWVGASYATKQSSHLKGELLTKLVSEKIARYIILLSLLVWLIFSLWITNSSFNLTLSILKTGQKSSAMQIPMFIPYASVPVGCGLMSIRLIQKIVDLLKGKDVG